MPHFWADKSEPRFTGRGNKEEYMEYMEYTLPDCDVGLQAIAFILYRFFKGHFGIFWCELQGKRQIRIIIGKGFPIWTPPPLSPADPYPLITQDSPIIPVRRGHKKYKKNTLQDALLADLCR